MNLLMSIGSWLQQNWMLLLLLVLAVAMVVPTYLKQKKEMNNRQELSDSIKKGTKIVTTAGVYGVVESVEETTDGKVVTIITGSSKNPCTMTIHINAIMGIDNKTKIDDGEKKTNKTKASSKNKEVESLDVDESNDIAEEDESSDK